MDAPWDTAHHLTDGVEATLGADRVAAAYVYGSLVHEAFVETQSDIDMIVLLDRELNSADILSLASFHGRFAAEHPAWDDRIEVQYVPAAAMWSFKSKPMPAAIISPGEPFHATVAGSDWLQNWYDVREHGVPLRGPGASNFIPPISIEEFVAAIRVYVAELRDRVDTVPGHRGSLAYIVLSLCRALLTCATGEQISKQDAAMEVRARLPGQRGTITWALEVRHGSRETQYSPADPVEFASVCSFVEEVAGRILEVRATQN